MSSEVLKAPQERNFNNLLEQRQIAVNSVLCVGLDPDGKDESFPTSIKDQFPDDPAAAKLEFNKQIINATHPFVCAYKLNFASYERDGDKGMEVLRNTVAWINKVDPTIPAIGDAKRGDIENTNKGYAEAVFDYMKFDAITVNPYLGSNFIDDLGVSLLGTMEPFLGRKNKGIFVLAKTSNNDSGEFQDLPIDLTNLPENYRKRFGDMTELRDIIGRNTASLSQIVTYRVSRYWNVNGNCGLVVGATYPEEFAAIRQIAGSKMTLLIPALGTQGGQPKNLTYAFNMFGKGIIASYSRGITNKSSGLDFAEIAGKEAQASRDAINVYR